MNQKVLNYDTVVTASANVKDTVRIEPQDSKKLLSGELAQPSFFPQCANQQSGTTSSQKAHSCLI